MVRSLATLQALLFGLLGLLAGVLYSFGGLTIDALVSSGLITHASTPGLSYGTALAFMALLGMPIIFALAGFMTGLAEAFLYDLFARWLGAFELDLSRGV